MSQYSIGDLAQSSLVRLQGTRLKSELLQLTEELSTGLVTDVGTHLRGDLGYYADVENNLRLLEGYDLAATEATQFADATQAVLDRVASRLSSSVDSTLPAAETAFQDMRDHASTDARYDLEAVISSLNASSVGRSLFSGTATDTPPLISADTFLDTLKAALPPISDPATLAAEVANWFADPSGFDAMAYNGSTTDLAPARIGENENVSMAVRADSDEIKAVLESLSLTALITDSDYGFDPAEQTEGFDTSSAMLLSAQARLTGLQADIGSAQERIEAATTRNAAARIGFETARSTLVGADPFETATRLDDVQFRLESLYAVTARMSSLTLLNYI